MLLLAHLYAKTDAASLARLRRELLRPKYSLTEIAVGTGIAATVVAGQALYAANSLPHIATFLRRPQLSHQSKFHMHLLCYIEIFIPSTLSHSNLLPFLKQFVCYSSSVSKTALARKQLLSQLA